MPTPRLLPPPVLALLLGIAVACSSGGPPPDDTPRPQQSPSQRGSRQPLSLDSARRNTVIENGRPDLPARAGMLVVANQEGASATVLDAVTLRTIVTLPVGNGPHEVAMSPDGRWAVVTIYGDRAAPGHTLAVIDLSLPTPAVTRTIELGQYTRPHGAAFAKGGAALLVTSETTQRLVLLDFERGTVDTALATNGRGSHLVATQRDGRRAWTGNINDGTVTEFDVEARRTIRTYPGAPMDEAIAATPGGVQVWVGSNEAHTVSIIDAAKGERIATLDGFGLPYRIGISRTGRVAAVIDPPRNRIWLYEVGSNHQLAELDLGGVAGIPSSATGAGARPEGITFDPISDFAYVTLHGTNQVAAVDLGKRKVVAVGGVGAGPDGIAFSPLVRRN